MNLKLLFFRFFNKILISTLVFYFIFHAWVVHYGSIPLTGTLVLFLVLIIISLVLQLLFRKWLDSDDKSTVFVFILTVIILFYGVFQNVVTAIRPIAEFGRITYFTPFCFLLLIVVFFYLRKSRSSFLRVRKYFAILLSLYILADIFQLAKNIYESREENSQAVAVRNNILKSKQPVNLPSIYLVVLDEYLGNECLAEYFHYPNSDFLKYLADNDFYVVKNPTSNYKETIFSMASLFDMDYIYNAGPINWLNHYAYRKSLQAINQNKTWRLLKEYGYEIRNKSLFYVSGQAPAFNAGLIPDKMNLAQHQTMYYKIAKALPDLLIGKFKIRILKQRYSDIADDYNHRILTEALNETARTDSVPAFTYIHLMMPHAPYLRDSSGKRIGSPPDENSVVHLPGNSAYLQYLVYTNKAISEFLTSLKQKTRGKAAILLMSDHGFRRAQVNYEKYSFNNLHAVYVPGHDYSGWYDGLSNVNALPQLFNTILGTKLQLKKDSIVK